MRTCSETDCLTTLSMGGAEELVSNKMMNIPDGVNLLDILPKVVAPSSDPLESCFLLPRPHTPDPEYIVGSNPGVNKITNLDTSYNILPTDCLNCPPTQVTPKEQILPPLPTPAPLQASEPLPHSSENFKEHIRQVTSKDTHLVRDLPPFLPG